jgi:hypothetical protein
VTRFPNPFTALTQLFVKAFATLADRDGSGGRSAFVVGVSRSKMRRSSRASTSQAQEASTLSAGPSATSTGTYGTLHRRRFADPRWASIRASESDLTTHATRKE